MFGKGKFTPAAPPAPAKQSNKEIARKVIEGNFGNGDARKARLTAAGYDYLTIQALVNSMLGMSGGASASSTIKVGNKVKVKPGAGDYKGGGIANFVYGDTWIVQEVSGSPIVVNKNVSGSLAICTAFKASDLILQ